MMTTTSLPSWTSQWPIALDLGLVSWRNIFENQLRMLRNPSSGSCQMCLLTGSPAFVIHLQLPVCFIYLCIYLSWVLGSLWSHLVWRCSICCESKFEEKARRIWFGHWGGWVAGNMSIWFVVISLMLCKSPVGTKDTVGIIISYCG